MSKKSYASTTLMYTLDEYNNGLYQNVVQKGNVGSKYCYALQLHGGKNGSNYVFRTPIQADMNFNKNCVLTLSGTACGHTQTFEYSGQSGAWFIGTKGKFSDADSKQYKWASQIARVQIPGGSFSSNTQLPRFSCLNRAGNGTKIDGSTFAGTDLYRSEAAVSPDYSKFLLATIDTNGNGYFYLYDLDEINQALNDAGTTDVDIGTIPCLESFAIPNITNEYNSIGSIQGYDLDNYNNIYISSQYSGKSNRNIYKIPWGASDQSQWDQISLTSESTLDTSGYYTELESVQVLSENDLYLTVAYHRNSDNATTRNRIFEVQW